MPPRSVCLNVFTNSLGESNAAVNEDGSLNAMGTVNGGMERRDSAQSGMFVLTTSSSHRPNIRYRHRATLLCRLYRIDIDIDISTHPVLKLPHPSLQPRRALPLPAPHGVYREPQLRVGRKAYVCSFHVASCRNPIMLFCFRVRAWGRPHSPRHPACWLASWRCCRLFHCSCV